jgi:hypothetical protein
VILDPRLAVIADARPYPLVLVTISGAHLYGFPSPDSDYDLRGAHILGAPDVIALDRGPDTLEISEISDGLDLDLVTHDIVPAGLRSKSGVRRLFTSDARHVYNAMKPTAL